MGTPAEEWIEEGKAEGKAEGRAEDILRILRTRFGEVDARLADRVRATDLDALDVMLDRAVTVEKPDDVIRGSGQH